MECDDGDIKDILVAWLSDNNSKDGLLESSLFNLIRILPIIQESSVLRIHLCLEVRLELDLHLQHLQMN